MIEFKRISLAGGNTLSLGSHCIIKGRIDLQKPQSCLIIGERSFLGANSIIVSTEKVKIGSDVLISHDCYITDTAGHSMDANLRKEDIPNRWKGYKDWSVVESKPIEIGDNAWIGPKCVILKGVKIGEGAVIAAGSVVTQDVHPFTVNAGVPAKMIKKIN